MAQQSAQPMETIVVDASTTRDTQRLCETRIPGLATNLTYSKAVHVGAAVQRIEALRQASQDLILLLDDDITFEADCILRLWTGIQGDPRMGGVNAMIANQQYGSPGVVSRLLFRFLNGRSEASYAGRCIGPAVNLLPEDRPDLPEIVPVEWLNSGCTLYRREALPHPLFPEHFTGYSLMEDVALSLVVGRTWKLANIRTARIFHDSQPADYKADSSSLARMELVNRHYVMTEILGRKRPADYFKLAVFETFGVVSALSSMRTLSRIPGIARGKLSAVSTILSARHRLERPS